MSPKIILPLIAASWIAAIGVGEHTATQMTVAATTFIASIAIYLLGGPILFLLTGIGLSLLPAQTILASLAMQSASFHGKIFYCACTIFVAWLSYVFASQIPLHFAEKKQLFSDYLKQKPKQAKQAEEIDHFTEATIVDENNMKRLEQK